MPKRFVAIWFPFLVTDWFAISDPSLSNKPFVIRRPVKGKMIIAASSPAAQAQGIFNGMVVADAGAIIPGLQVLDEKPDLTDKLLKLLALWSIRFTPFTAPNPPQGLILNASGCSHLWGGDDLYLKEIRSRLRQRGYHVRTAMADTIGSAWALARYEKEQLLVETGLHAKALLPLPIEGLRLDEIAVEHLHKLGIHKIKDLIHMPTAVLRRRFGPQLIQKIDQALGLEEEPVDWIRPPLPYQERLPCLEPIVTREGIEIALKKLLTILCSRLQQDQKGLRSAVFKAYQVEGTLAQIVIETNAPSCSTVHLFKLFEIRVPIIQVGSGIELFILEAPRVEDLVAKQERLWETIADAGNAHLAELLDRLAVKLGPQHILRYLPNAHYLPERAIRKAASLQETPQESWRLEKPRPVQLLQNPELIEVTAPIPDYPPMMFRYKGKLHKIKKADGPERIEQEWWIEEGEHRDYYYVEDEEGCRYWLFRTGHYNEEKTYKWFIHGFFS